MPKRFLVAAVLTRLGIGGATPDANNRLAVSSPQALFDNAGAGVSLYINKAAAANDAGFTFQTNFSTRALFGTLGSDDFVLKVSPDGSAFYTGITIAAATGIAAFTLSPTAPTPSSGDSSSKVATTAYADRAAGAGIAPRTQVNDANYTIVSTDRVIAIVAISAARTLTLPAASAFPQGATLAIFDESGAVSGVRPVTVARNGTSDSIDGAASASILSPYGYVALQSNGANKWTVVNQTFGSGALSTVTAGAAGSSMQFGCLEQLVSTASGASVSSTINIPNRAIVFAVSSTVVTTVTGPSSFSVGVSGNTGQFGGSLGTAAGSQNVGVIGPTAFYSPTPIVLTAGGGTAFTGGAVRIAIQYVLPSAPTS